MDFADIVHESEQSPLYIHFQFRAEGEALHALVDTDVGKDRFHDPQASGVDLPSLLAIDPGLHRIDQVQGLGSGGDGKIPARGGGCAQTARLQGAGGGGDGTLDTCTHRRCGVARVVYRMLKYKVEYEPLSVAEYEKHYQNQQLKYLQKKAAKFGLQLVPT